MLIWCDIGRMRLFFQVNIVITPPGTVWGSPGTNSPKAGLVNGGLPGTFSPRRPVGVPQAPLAIELELTSFL